MSEEPIERGSLHDLAIIIQEARKLGTKLVLIGGYAVAAYTRGYRYTKDIDLVAHKPAIGRIKGLLSSLGYQIRATEFGIAGSKRLNKGFIDLHISVGKILDISTSNYYPVDEAFFGRARRLTIRGYYSKNSALKASVVDLESLLVLKLMPTGRQKDEIDLLSLLLDRRQEINPSIFAERVKVASLTAHMLSRTRDYAERLRRGQIETIWLDETASRLPHVQRREILAFLAKLADQLRQP